MNVQDMNDVWRDLVDRPWTVKTRDLQELWKHQDLSSDQKGKVLDSLLHKLKTEEIKEILRQEDLSTDHKEKVVDALLRRLGPWKLADSGVLDELERDLIVRQRIKNLWDGVNHYIESVFSLIALIVFTLIFAALAAYVHEDWGIIWVIAIGLALITGVLGRLLAAPFQLIGIALRLKALKHGRRLSFLGEPEFDLLERNPLRLTKLETDELKFLAKDKDVLSYDSLSREGLIRVLAEIPDK